LPVGRNMLCFKPGLLFRMPACQGHTARHICSIKECRRRYGIHCLDCCLADGSSDQEEATVMVQLARIQQAAAAWLGIDAQELPTAGTAVRMVENLPGTQWLPFTSQVRCTCIHVEPIILAVLATSSYHHAGRCCKLQFLRCFSSCNAKLKWAGAFYMFWRTDGLTDSSKRHSSAVNHADGVDD
jgi:hypothetical protein